MPTGMHSSHRGCARSIRSPACRKRLSLLSSSLVYLEARRNERLIAAQHIERQTLFSDPRSSRVLSILIWINVDNAWRSPIPRRCFQGCHLRLRIPSSNYPIKRCLKCATHRPIERRITNPKLPIIGELHNPDVSLIESALELAISFKTQFGQLVVRDFSPAEDLHENADDFFGIAVHWRSLVSLHPKIVVKRCRRKRSKPCGG